MKTIRDKANLAINGAPPAFAESVHGDRKMPATETSNGVTG